jgi:Cu(I)/Ag(I) efflux system protein CusF
MKNTVMIACSLAIIPLLGACKKEPAAVAPTEAAPAASDAMADMPMAPAMKHGMAVTAIDAAKGTITLDHGAMSGLGWPAMTMGFAAKPDQLAGIKIGDKVNFEVDWDGKAGTITKIVKSGP